jgi:hypothetical protein
MKKKIISIASIAFLIAAYYIGTSSYVFAEEPTIKYKLKIKCPAPYQSYYKWTCTGSTGEVCHYNMHCPKTN